MQPEFNHLDGEEQIKAENDFLKMKLMLEHGGHFVGSGDNPVPSDVENEFLNNIIEFEKQFESRRTIKVFDKIGKPDHFKPAAEVPDDEIDQSWQKLKELLNAHDIELGVCSPNITVRELYRFAIEELFGYEMDDMDLPGWVSHFIYDEFHPDPVYDNSRLVEEDLLRDIFRPQELFHEVNFDGDGFTFNDNHYAEFAAYAEKINRFKSCYQEIELAESTINDCSINEKTCSVKGTYKAIGKDGGREDSYQGNFEVELVRKDFDYWYFKAIKIEGLNV